MKEIQYFLNVLEIENPSAYQDFVPTRSVWIESFKDDRNPFDEKALQAL